MEGQSHCEHEAKEQISMSGVFTSWKKQESAAGKRVKIRS